MSDSSLSPSKNLIPKGKAPAEESPPDDKSSSLSAFSKLKNGIRATNQLKDQSTGFSRAVASGKLCGKVTDYCDGKGGGKGLNQDQIEMSQNSSGPFRPNSNSKKKKKKNNKGGRSARKRGRTDSFNEDYYGNAGIQEKDEGEKEHDVLLGKQKETDDSGSHSSRCPSLMKSGCCNFKTFLSFTFFILFLLLGYWYLGYSQVLQISTDDANSHLKSIPEYASDLSNSSSSIQNSSALIPPTPNSSSTGLNTSLAGNMMKRKKNRRNTKTTVSGSGRTQQKFNINDKRWLEYAASNGSVTMNGPGSNIKYYDLKESLASDSGNLYSPISWSTYSDLQLQTNSSIVNYGGYDGDTDPSSTIEVDEVENTATYSTKSAEDSVEAETVSETKKCQQIDNWNQILEDFKVFNNKIFIPTENFNHYLESETMCITSDNKQKIIYITSDYNMVLCFQNRLSDFNYYDSNYIDKITPKNEKEYVNKLLDCGSAQDYFSPNSQFWNKIPLLTWDCQVLSRWTYSIRSEPTDGVQKLLQIRKNKYKLTNKAKKQLISNKCIADEVKKFDNWDRQKKIYFKVRDQVYKKKYLGYEYTLSCYRFQVNSEGKQEYILKDEEFKLYWGDIKKLFKRICKVAANDNRLKPLEVDTEKKQD